jgi:hypothetical protein
MQKFSSLSQAVTRSRKPMVQLSQPYPDILQAATELANRPPAATVVEALLQAEKAAKQQRLLYPADLLLGNWRLGFTTGTRKLRRGGIALGKGFYLPGFVQAQIGFSLAELPAAAESTSIAASPIPVPLQISNQLTLAGGCLRFTGPARYLNKKNLLAFDFTKLELSLAQRSLYRGNIRGGSTQAAAFSEKPIAQLPFFSFFWVTPSFIAARGRGGGLAIWVKEITEQK